MSLPPLRVTYLRSATGRAGEFPLESVSLNEKSEGLAIKAIAEPGRLQQLPASASVSGRLQAGFGVSTRNFKKATDRNRIKRLLRESYRTCRAPLSDTVSAQPYNLSIFIMYASREMPLWLPMKLKMTELIRKLTNKIHEPAAKNR